MPNGRATRPDFRVTCPDGQSLYLEAVCASDNDGRNLAAEARKSAALQILDSATHPNFMVAIDSEGDPTTQPSGNRLTAAVVRWLDTLDADALLEQATGGYEVLPEMSWQHEDWRVRIRPIPVRAEARGRPRRLIGMRNYGAGWIDGWTPIRDAVLYKARRYGKLDLPLIVAVNVNTFNLDPIDEAQALFGQEQYVFNVGAGQPEPRFERAPNGAWWGPSGPRGRTCSGAWLFNNLSPYTVARRGQTLYVNPWAHIAPPTAFLQMPHAFAIDGHVQHAEGRNFREVFALDEVWPE